MEEGLAAIREQIDRLTARNWALEALLLAVTQRMGMNDMSGFLSDTWDFSDQYLEHLKYSNLTDRQLDYFREEIQRLAQRREDFHRSCSDRQ